MSLCRYLEQYTIPLLCEAIDEHLRCGFEHNAEAGADAVIRVLRFLVHVLDRADIGTRMLDATLLNVLHYCRLIDSSAATLTPTSSAEQKSAGVQKLHTPVRVVFHRRNRGTTDKQRESSLHNCRAGVHLDVFGRVSAARLQQEQYRSDVAQCSRGARLYSCTERSIGCTQAIEFCLAHAKLDTDSDIRSKHLPTLLHRMLQELRSAVSTTQCEGV